MINTSILSARSRNILLSWFVLFAIFLTSLYSFLLFHSIAELTSIVISFSVFMLAWNTRQYQRNYYLQLIGIAFLFICMLDLVHTLSYKGMGIFTGYGANLPTQLWIAARYMQSISFLLAPIYLHRQLRVRHAFLIYGLITTLILVSIFYWDIFPACYIEGGGLTPFKVISEYLISALLGISALLLWRDRRNFDPQILNPLLFSVFAAILSELFFTSYVGVYDSANLIGHLFKVIASFFIYQAIIQNGIVKPFALLFHDLQDRADRLDQSQREMETRVSERTRDLTDANRELAIENQDRRVKQERTDAILDNIQALREIDQAIIASQNIQDSLTVIMDKTIQRLSADAACILLMDKDQTSLYPVIHHGFSGTTIDKKYLNFDASPAGCCLKGGENIFISNIHEYKNDFFRRNLMLEENFVSYYCSSISTKLNMVGVLEVYQHNQLAPDEEWQVFFNTLAGQTAIAIDNATLFENLQLINRDLHLAYDKTLQGWVQALAYKGKETEAHTLRVVSLTIELARRMGISAEEIEHIQRGALLHDIGKMAIPDSILLKPGPLTAEERAIMEKHPIYAREWLTPIDYLAPAIDIPFYHHEKWDGSGYPLGLRGEEIPLSARIFALVDVWDALNSDRPYRNAWPPERVLAYIKEQSGKHFDPAVLSEFLAMIEEMGLQLHEPA